MYRKGYEENAKKEVIIKSKSSIEAKTKEREEINVRNVE